MELAEKFEGVRVGRTETPLPFGIWRSAAHHAGMAAEMLGWHGSAKGLGELPQCPASRGTQESILPETQEGKGELRPFFLRHIWELESKGKAG